LKSGRVAGEKWGRGSKKELMEGSLTGFLGKNAASDRGRSEGSLGKPQKRGRCEITGKVGAEGKAGPKLTPQILKTYIKKKCRVA